MAFSVLSIPIPRQIRQKWCSFISGWKAVLNGAKEFPKKWPFVITFSIINYKFWPWRIIYSIIHAFLWYNMTSFCHGIGSWCTSTISRNFEGAATSSNTTTWRSMLSTPVWRCILHARFISFTHWAHQNTALLVLSNIKWANMISWDTQTNRIDGVLAGSVLCHANCCWTRCLFFPS